MIELHPDCAHDFRDPATGDVGDLQTATCVHCGDRMANHLHHESRTPDGPCVFCGLTIIEIAELWAQKAAR